MFLYPYTINQDFLTLTVGGEETGQPLKNLYDADWNTFFQNDTADEDVTIDIDFTENRDTDYLTLGKHNYTDTSTGIKLSWDSNQDGNYSALTYLIGSGGAFHDYTTADGEIWIETFSSVTKRYYRLELESRAALKRFIGVMSLGAVKDVNNYNLGNQRGDIYHNADTVSPGGIVRVISNWGGKQEINISYDDIPQADLDAWLKVADNANGDVYPFFIKDYEDTEYYVRFTESGVNFRKIEHELYAMSTKLIQENV